MTQQVVGFFRNLLRPVFLKSYDLQTGENFEISTVLGSFVFLLENYRANSQVVFNRNTRLWESLLHRPRSALADKVCISESQRFDLGPFFFRTNLSNLRRTVQKKEAVALIFPEEAVTFLYEKCYVFGKIPKS